MYKNLAIFLVLSILFVNCGQKQGTKSDVKDNDTKQTSQSTESAGKQSDIKTKKASDKDEIMIPTPDSKQVSANYFYNKDTKDSKEPLVVLIHQFMETKEQWQQSFVDTLVSQGYKVLAYDIRGHGKSSKVSYDLTKLLDDPNEAPNDIKGVFDWAKTQNGIDTARIAAIGTSIGGNVACYASFYLGAKTCVAISNGKETFEKFLNYDERSMSRPFIKKSKAIFFICGAKDDDHEKGQRFMMDQFVDDPKEIKVFDSDKHGKDLILEHPEIYTLITNWLKKNL